MSTTFITTPPLSLSPPSPAVGRLPQINSWHAATAVTRLWAARRAQRRALGELAEQSHLLADIGLTRAQALHEAAKPFWRR
jgi:uncharacterized protein YjiS (DUF1127 family)